MSRLRVSILVALFGVFAAVIAVAESPDPRGWSAGIPAALSSRVLGGMSLDREVDLPKSLTRSLEGPTLLVYFSPTCPHCRAVAPEINGLSRRLDGKVTVVGVASGAIDRSAVDEFSRTFKVPYRIVHDTDRAISQAMGVRSTPSALLVVPKRKAWTAKEAWYPYSPGYDTLVELAAYERPWDAFRPGEYHGIGTCAACHVQEAEAWYLSHHAVAWRTLVRMDKQEDSACTSCHVTGAGTPGGWTPEGPTDLVNVGCEACHSAGGPHDGESVEPKDTCEGCHDAKHSIAFSYERGLPLLDHFRTVGMEDSDFQSMREALLEGEVPQSMISFAEGTFVGDQACASCHATEHKAWKDSPHGKSMASLKGDEASQVDCVRCHASPKEAGPPSPDLADYVVERGVSCESCHGPGEAHVAAKGGTDNIEGLGDDCPVCVLEALCTSCHTPEWDKPWDLETRLQSIRVYHRAE